MAACAASASGPTQGVPEDDGPQAIGAMLPGDHWDSTLEMICIVYGELTSGYNELALIEVLFRRISYNLAFGIIAIFGEVYVYLPVAHRWADSLRVFAQMW